MYMFLCCNPFEKNINPAVSAEDELHYTNHTHQTMVREKSNPGALYALYDMLHPENQKKRRVLG